MDEQLKQVLTVLMQGVEIAQQKGAYTLQDAGVLAQAVDAGKRIIEEKGDGETTPVMEVEEAKEDKPKK